MGLQSAIDTILSIQKKVDRFDFIKNFNEIKFTLGKFMIKYLENRMNFNIFNKNSHNILASSKLKIYNHDDNLDEYLDAQKIITLMPDKFKELLKSKILS